jgi:hypothetical protein
MAKLIMALVALVSMACSTVKDEQPIDCTSLDVSSPKAPAGCCLHIEGQFTAGFIVEGRYLQWGDLEYSHVTTELEVYPRGTFTISVTDRFADGTCNDPAGDQ